MTELALSHRFVHRLSPQGLVDLSVKTWFAIATMGHGLFLLYILVVFYPPIAAEGLEGLRGSHLPSGFREGETWGNLASVSHVLLAAIVIGGGPLQVIAGVRQRFPVFHRCLGRTYVTAALVAAVGGLYMSWFRSPIGDVFSKIGISIDALLIIVCAVFAVLTARARRFREHRRWALRLFIVAGAVWFYRVGLMGWVLMTGGVGIESESFTGPFLWVLGIAQYLLPLGMLEWYFQCQRRSSGRAQLAFAGTLALLTLYMALGIGGATMGLWLPRL